MSFSVKQLVRKEIKENNTMKQSVRKEIQEIIKKKNLNCSIREFHSKVY